MNTVIGELRAVWRWYHLLCATRAARVVHQAAATRAACYGLSAAFLRAAKGLPNGYGPHQFVDAMMLYDLRVNQSAVSEQDPGRWFSSSLTLLEWEATLLCRSLGLIYAVRQAIDISPVALRTMEDAILSYDPVAPRWLDGFTHKAEIDLAAGAVHRLELVLDDPEEPAADFEALGRAYADGELHRHLGWTQRSEAKEVDQHGQQAAEVRDQCVSDQARPDDQVEGQRADRRPVPGQSPRPGAHDAHADHH